MLYIDSMAIKNCDGTPYQPAGSMQTFDPYNPEHDLFNQWDQELITFGGSPIFYYDLLLQRDTIDPLYREDRGKLWSTCEVQLYGLYEPIPAQNYMNTFGLDAPDEMKFEFNYRAVLKAIGHPPKIGARLFTPHKRENWVIVQRNVDQFKLWGELHVIIMAQRFQEGIVTGEGKIRQKMPDFKLNEGALLH